MKKLSLLMFAILILGCGTETTVVEEPPPVVEESPPIIEEPTPIIEEPPPPEIENDMPELDDNLFPRIAEGSVLDGDFNVDPEPLNQDGFRYTFTESLKLISIEIFRDGKTLHWLPRDVIASRGRWDGVGDTVQLRPGANSQLLEYDTRYVIKIYIQNFECVGKAHTIRFRTRPRKIIAAYPTQKELCYETTRSINPRYANSRLRHRHHGG